MKKRKFIKLDSAKPRLDLLPPRALEFVGQVLRHGAVKYPPGNYLNCEDPSRYVGPIVRHTVKHMRGEFTDDETGLPHLAHALASGLFALELYLRGREDAFTMGNYFAIVRKRASGRGVVVKRFRTYVKAWAYLEDHKLDPETYLIKTVMAREKVSKTVKI